MTIVLEKKKWSEKKKKLFGISCQMKTHRSIFYKHFNIDPIHHASYKEKNPIIKYFDYKKGKRITWSKIPERTVKKMINILKNYPKLSNIKLHKHKIQYGLELTLSTENLQETRDILQEYKLCRKHYDGLGMDIDNRKWKIFPKKLKGNLHFYHLSKPNLQLMFRIIQKLSEQNKIKISKAEYWLQYSNI